MRYYLKDKQSDKYLSFNYIGMNSDNISFYTVENKSDAAKFRHEINAIKYSSRYKEVTGLESYFIEE